MKILTMLKILRDFKYSEKDSIDFQKFLKIQKNSNKFPRFLSIPKNFERFLEISKDSGRYR